MRNDLQLTLRQRLPSIVSGYTAINAVVKAEPFPMQRRALGVGSSDARGAPA